MDPRDLWQAVLAQLRGQMSPATFDTWMRPTVGLDLSGDTLVIGVPSSYAEDWITQRLNGALTATIAAELGETAKGSDHYRILFVLGTLLFLITFLVNITADLVIRGIKKR